MVYGMAMWAWHGIWLSLAEIAYGVLYGLYGMAWWAWNAIWYGLVGIPWYMVWPGGHGGVYDIV